MVTAPGIAGRIDDRKAWREDTVDDRARWYHAPPAGLITAVEALVAGLPRESGPAADLPLNDRDRTSWAEWLAPARRELETGRGFVILDRLPTDRLSAPEATALYWLIGRLLGEPVAQDVQGTLLYDVRDTGRDVASGARFSVTSYESSFHTDNSFGETVVDYVGLLCLKAAKSGGISQNVSGYAVHDVLRREHPDVLETLARPFHVDRRGGFPAGEAPTVLRPVIARDGTELLFRYLRYWIEAGHEKAGEPLSAAQRHALDVLDAVLQRPALRVEFSLQPGQCHFINNRWILHNRTAFEDQPEPDRRRHLVRLWLKARDGHDQAR